MIELGKLHELHQQWLALIDEAVLRKEKVTEFICGVRKEIDALTQQQKQYPRSMSIMLRIKEYQTVLQNSIDLLEQLQRKISEFYTYKAAIEQLIQTENTAYYSPSM